MVWCGLVWYVFFIGLLWFVLVWFGLAWYGLGVVCFGMLFLWGFGIFCYGLVWFGMVSILQELKTCFHILQPNYGNKILKVDVPRVLGSCSHILNKKWQTRP